MHTKKRRPFRPSRTKGITNSANTTCESIQFEHSGYILSSTNQSLIYKEFLQNKIHEIGRTITKNHFTTNKPIFCSINPFVMRITDFLRQIYIIITSPGSANFDKPMLSIQLNNQIAYSLDNSRVTFAFLHTRFPCVQQHQSQSSRKRPRASAINELIHYCS